MDNGTRPVTNWENQSVGGIALCSEGLFLDHVEDAKKLRERQAQYEASLPTEPDEVIRSARRILHPNGNSYPEGVEEALQLSCALAVIVRHGDLEVPSPERDAALYLAERLEDATRSAVGKLDRLSDVLSAKSRQERKEAERQRLSEREVASLLQGFDDEETAMFRDALTTAVEDGGNLEQELETLKAKIEAKRAKESEAVAEKGGED